MSIWRLDRKSDVGTCWLVLFEADCKIAGTSCSCMSDAIWEAITWLLGRNEKNRFKPGRKARKGLYDIVRDKPFYQCGQQNISLKFFMV